MTTIEKAFLWLLYSAATLLVAGIFTMFIMPAKVTEYSLSDGGGSNILELKIQKHIDWAPDDYIILDRSVTIEEATEIVRKLNEGIK